MTECASSFPKENANRADGLISSAGHASLEVENYGDGEARLKTLPGVIFLLVGNPGRSRILTGSRLPGEQLCPALRVGQSLLSRGSWI